jgi:hypothetical protein
MIKTKGRMLNKSISNSKGIAKLNPKSLSLFALLIPHLNSHGKMNGNPYFIKGEVCPRIEWLDIKTIEKCLIEISKHTNIKWFEFENLQYIQSIKFFNYQKLRDDRKGADTLPDYSGTTPGLVHTTATEQAPEDQPEIAKPDTEKSNLSKKEQEERFNKLWQKIPNKIGKSDSLKKYKSTVKTIEDDKKINIALDNYMNSANVKKGYILKGSNWFKDWQDWIDFVEPDRPVSQREETDLDRLIKRAEAAEAKEEAKQISETGDFSAGFTNVIDASFKAINQKEK